MSSGTKSKTLSPETSVPCNLQVACCCLMQFSAEKESLVVLLLMPSLLFFVFRILVVVVVAVGARAVSLVNTSVKWD